MMKSQNTIEGLEELGQLIKTIREDKGLSLRKFASLGGCSRSTIDRIERGLTKTPPESTWEALAAASDKTVEQLKAIARQQPLIEGNQVQTAEDVLPFVDRLPKKEAIRLAQLIINRVSGIDTPLPTLPDVGELPQMDNQELSAILRVISDRLSNS